MNELKANILSFDVEEWFQVSNFSRYIQARDWDKKESRVEIGINFILETLKTFNVSATFFLVGWVAERHPEIVERILENGHEIGIHGYLHRNITDQTESEFASDIKHTIKSITDITSVNIKGYRAPSYTVTPATFWALDILKDLGIEYDSSLYPIKGHPIYGFPNAPRHPFKFSNGIYEFPISTFKIFEWVFPFGSGGYFRFFPFFLTNFIMDRCDKAGETVTVNIHPWEFDPDQERLSEIDWLSRFKHYINISKNRKKFVKLLNNFRFTTFSNYIESNSFPLVEYSDGNFGYI